MLNEFGSAETYRSGALDIYIGASQSGLVLKIPWSATGRNPCRVCWSLDGELFSPEGFPGLRIFIVSVIVQWLVLCGFSKCIFRYITV